MNNDEIIKKLNIFGLEEKEALIYLMLLQKGIKTPLELARLTEVNRTTIYRIVERLQDLNLVEEMLDQNTTKYKAIPPDKFELLVAKKEAELKTLKETLPTLQAELSQLVGNLPANTKVKYYRGKSGFEQIIWNQLHAIGNIVGYSTFGRREVVGDKFYDEYVREFEAKNITDRVITTPTEETLAYLKKHVLLNRTQMEPWNIRYLEESQIYISGDTVFYNDIFATAYWRQGEIVGVEIENHEFVRMQKSIFEILWENAKPIGEIIKDQITKWTELLLTSKSKHVLSCHQTESLSFEQSEKYLIFKLLFPFHRIFKVKIFNDLGDYRTRHA